MKGIRTDCVTGKVSEIEVSYEVADGVFTLLGGPTGYESFRIDDAKTFKMAENGWTACAGTKNQYDHLFIPAEEMRDALEKIIAAERVRNAFRTLKNHLNDKNEERAETRR